MLSFWFLSPYLAFTPCPQLTEIINTNYTFWVGEAEKEAANADSNDGAATNDEDGEEEVTAIAEEEAVSEDTKQTTEEGSTSTAEP